MKEKVKKFSVVTLPIICVTLMCSVLSVQAGVPYTEGTFQAGSTYGKLEVGIQNTYGYANVSASGGWVVDANLSGSITYAAATGTSDKYFSHSSHERSYTEAVCYSPSGSVSFIECHFYIYSPDGNTYEYLAKKKQ